jgi:Na-Ca exchanger/integrin-beta4
MRKKIMTLMMGMLLLLTACGQTGSNSASAMLPVAAVQSAAQAIAPVEDKVQEDTESLSAEETVEETKDAGSEETPKPTKDAETPSGKTEKTPSSPTGEEQPDAPDQPTTPEQTMSPAPQPEPVPSEPEPAPVQEQEPTPAPEPEPEPEYEPADRWAAVEAASAYAAAQYGVTTDSGLTLGNSAYRFPASVAADASQETLEAKARDMVDYTFHQLMMQAGVNTLADAGICCNVCIVEDGASLLIYVLYAG